MFKRCHSLKRSQLKIPEQIRQKGRSKKPLLTQQSQKQNIVSNYKYSNVLLIKSIEYSKQKTIASTQRTQQSNFGYYHNLYTSKFVADEKVLETIKLLCKQIQNVSHKIAIYREILCNKEARHEKNRQTKMENKENELAKLIELYQKSKKQGQILSRQLSILGISQEPIVEKDVEDKRRTTATFNFMLSK